jgi:capsular exopolysaccharide synthesis family protein
MSLVELALQKRKASEESAGRSPVDEQPTTASAPLAQESVVPTVSEADEGSLVLQPAAGSVVADLDTAVVGAMRFAWELRGDAALVSQLRNIRREIGALLSGPTAGTRARVVVVTSALPGDGKSFVSIGLARALASERERRVVLVDADVPKGHLSSSLRVADQPGFVNCLAGERTLADVVCRTDVATMSFVPSGAWRPDAPELLCNSNVDHLFATFRSCDRRHAFVVDTAPVLAVGETLHLAQKADLVILVVRAGHTPRSAVQDAVHKLGTDRPVAIVLNGQTGSGLDAYYGYRDYYVDYPPSRGS